MPLPAEGRPGARGERAHQTWPPSGAWKGEEEQEANNPKQLPLYILYLRTDVRACLSFSPELFLLFLNLAVTAGDVAKRARPAAPSLLGVTLPGLPCSEAEVARLHSFLTLGQVRIFTPR